MNAASKREPACERALEFLDTHVGHEPPSSPEGEILKHFEQCPRCARELEIRNRITGRLKQAVQNEPVSPYLEAKVRRTIREHGIRGVSPWSWRRLVPVAAALVVCLGGWIAYQLGHLRVTTASQETYIQAISEKVSGILRVGLRDHVHCTVFRKFPKEPPGIPEMRSQLGSEYAGLLTLVNDRVPARYRVMMAHRCSYHGRKFVHLALSGDSKLISLVITRKGEGESFHKDGLRPVLSEAGLAIYGGGVQRFAIAAFETRDHLAYLVSDLGRRQNLDLLAALAPPVKDFLDSLEG